MKKYFVTKKFPASEFSCVFRQWKAESHCRFLHGYAIEIEITLEAESLDDRNWVFDFAGFRDLREKMKEFFDHKVIVAQDDPLIDRFFDLESMGLAQIVVMENVGIEAFSEFVAGMTKNWLSEATDRNIRIASIQIREHQSNAAGIFWR